MLLRLGFYDASTAIVTKKVSIFLVFLWISISGSVRCHQGISKQKRITCASILKVSKLKEKSKRQ